MKTLLNDGDREQILERIGRLGPDSERLWGAMTAHQMICHVADQLCVAMGEIPGRRRDTFVSRTFIKWFALYLMPRIPRGKIRTVSEMQTSDPGQWEVDTLHLRNAVDRFPRCEEFSPHPVFGPMAPSQWGILAHRHLNHHLKQFGQ